MDRLQRIEAAIAVCSDKKKLRTLYKAQNKEKFMEDAMNEYAQAYKDAAEIVRNTRVSISSGPVQPWAFLNRVERYLNNQCSAEFAADWQQLRNEETQSVAGAA